MTRKAIEFFKFQRKIFCDDYLKICPCPKDSVAYQVTLKEKEFYDMAIKALEQKPCNDAISRKAVLDTTICEGISCNECSFNEIDGEPGCLLHARIDELPSVTQKSETVTEFADRCRECGAKYGKLLKQEPCEDAISRQDVLDLAKKGVLVSNGNYESVCKAINELSPVNPQHKWETCFDCPVSHGCPKIKGCTNEQALEYANKIPNDCPLFAQPEQKTDGDTISRQAVLDLPRIKTHNEWGNIIKESVDVENVRQLPSVNPQPKTGHWIRELIRNEKGGCIGAKMICSECGNDNKHDEYMDYCPNCGFRMV